MADELRHSGKDLGHRREQDLSEVVDGGERDAPLGTHPFEDGLCLRFALRADLPAVEHLAAHGVHADQQHPAPLLAGSVDMEDVAAPPDHVRLQRGHAFPMDDLHVGDELPGQVADGPERDVKGEPGGEIGPDLGLLTALEEVGDPDPDHEVVGMVAAHGEEPRELGGADGGPRRMHRTEAGLLDGDDPSVPERDDLALAHTPETERSGAAAGSVVRGRGEGDAREGGRAPGQERRRPLPLLPEQVEDGYGALSLSRSYRRKIASTTVRLSLTPAPPARETISSRPAPGSLTARGGRR